MRNLEDRLRNYEDRLRKFRRTSSTISTMMKDSKRESREERTRCNNEFIASNRNANTQRTYTSGWKQFITWVEDVEDPKRNEEERVNVDRPDELDVALYMQYLVMNRNITMATLTSLIASISDHLRLLITSSYNPCSGQRIKQMRAVLMPMMKEGKQKKEISYEQLEAIQTATDAAGDAMSERDCIMMMIAYFAFLRVSEVARMNRSDITFSMKKEGGVATEKVIMRVHVNRMSKNDSERKGHERLIENVTEGYCIVSRMYDYMAKTTSKGDGPLFATTGGKRLHVNTPRGRMKVWMMKTGVKDHEEYGFHSLRAGAATDSARAGVDERLIKLHGNWKSDAVRVYIRPSEEERLSVSSAIGKKRKRENE